MSDITATDGTVLHIDDDSVAIVSGLLPSNPPGRTYVIGPAAGPIRTDEAAAAFVGRLHPKNALIRLTRPDGSPVWVSGPAVSAVRAPTPSEIPPGEAVGAVVLLAGRHQAVEEGVAPVRAAVNAHGGHV